MTNGRMFCGTKLWKRMKDYLIKKIVVLKKVHCVICVDLIDIEWYVPACWCWFRSENCKMYLMFLVLKDLFQGYVLIIHKCNWTVQYNRLTFLWWNISLFKRFFDIQSQWIQFSIHELFTFRCWWGCKHLS